MTRFARPCRQPARRLAVCPTGCASCRTPVGGSHPPCGEYKEKSPYFRTGSHLEYGGEGGFTRFARPCGQPAYCVRGLSNWLRQLSNPGRGFSSPCGEYKEKSPYFRTGSHLEYGGEGGIRTPDTLPYTHFPGVLLQPLGHLTILSFPLLSGTGANVGKYVSPVNQLFAKKSAFRQTSSNLLLKRAKSVFFVASSFSLFARGEICYAGKPIENNE